jgi:hypothetical protein
MKTDALALLAERRIFLLHNLRVMFEAIRQLMAPPPAPPKAQIGFHIKEDAVQYRTAKRRD